MLGMIRRRQKIFDSEWGAQKKTRRRARSLPLGGEDAV